jgi:hemerythrin
VAYFDWTRDLELGVTAMDAEHRQLIDKMNRVYVLDQQQAGRVRIAAAFSDLGTFIKQHFADEEAHMQQIGFPDLRRHAAIHADLLRRFGEHLQSFDRGDGRVPPSMIRFLVSWLASHIKGIDRKYAEHQAPVRA